MFKSVFLAATVTASIAIRARAADTYPIKLESQLHVGDIKHVSRTATYKLSQKWTVPTGKKPYDTAFCCALEGVETIDAVNAKQIATRVTVVVESCTSDKQQLLLAGATITKNQQTFTVNGRKPADNVWRVLDELISTARDNQPSPDEEMGVEQPQKVGSKWPVNCDLLAKATRLPYPLNAADFHGQGRLLDVSNVDGNWIETIYLSDACEFTNRQGSNGKTFSNLKMNFAITMAVPVDAKASCVNKTVWHRTLTFNVAGPTGTADVREERSGTSTVAPEHN